MRGITAVLVGLVACGGSDGLSSGRLPQSTSTAEIPAAEALVAVGASEVRLDGEPLTTVDEVIRGSAAALEAGLRARAAAIEAAAARDPAAPAFRGAYSIEVDRDLPAEVLSRVLAAAARARFDSPWVVVVDAHGARHGIRLTIPEVASAEVSAAEQAGEVAVGGYANPTVAVLPAQGFVVTASDRVVDPGSGLSLRCGTTPCGETWPTVELTRLARRIKLDHPKDRAVVVAPAAGATVQMVVTTFDAMRDDAFAGHGTREMFPEALLAEAPP